MMSASASQTAEKADSGQEFPGIPISLFSSELQQDLAQMDTDHDGILDTKEIEAGMKVLINDRKGLISIKSFNPKMVAELKKLGADDTGYLHFTHVEEALASLLDHKKKMRHMTWALISISIAAVIFLCAMFGLVYAVVDMNKDMRTMHGALVDRATGLPLQTASSDFTISDGALIPRTQQTNSTNRRSQSERLGDYMNDDFPVPGAQGILQTAIYNRRLQVNSSWRPTQLQTLKTLMTTSEYGFISADVHGFVIINQHDRPNLVIFDSSAGRLVLNGTSFSPAEGYYATASLSQLFQTLPATHASAQGRRLAQAGMQCKTPCCDCPNYPYCVVPQTGALCLCQDSCAVGF